MGLLSLFKKKKDEEPRCSAVIVSAGLALYAFQDCSAIREIIVVAREDLVVEVGRLCKEFDLDKVRKVIVGGGERIQSVQAGLREVDPESSLVAIHDGARPPGDPGVHP